MSELARTDGSPPALSVPGFTIAVEVASVDDVDLMERNELLDAPLSPWDRKRLGRPEPMIGGYSAAGSFEGDATITVALPNGTRIETVGRARVRLALDDPYRRGRGGTIRVESISVETKP